MPYSPLICSSYSRSFAVGTVPADICTAAETNNNSDPASRHGNLINLFLGYNQLTGVLDVSKCRGLIILDVSVGVGV